MLKQQKVLYIADIVEQAEDQTLANLLDYSRKNLSELLDEINDDADNEYKFKVSHRNKFAKAVIQIAEKRNRALKAQFLEIAESTPSSPSPFKLLEIGKEEEMAIEGIQTGHKFMIKRMSKMKGLFDALDQNTESAKASIRAICHSMRHQIDEKEKKMMSMVAGIHEIHLDALTKRDEAVQQSAKNVAKVMFSAHPRTFSNI